MFSLIITVISIALVAALALATLYYGGAAYERGQADAQAAKVRIQGQQLMGADDIFKAHHGRYSNDVAELIAEDYLKSNPVARAALQEALAENAWYKPLAGEALFLLATDFPEACRSINEEGYGQRAILTGVVDDIQLQCYGPNVNTLYSMAAKDPKAVQALLNAEESLVVGPAPIPTLIPEVPSSVESPYWSSPPGSDSSDDDSGNNGSGALNAVLTPQSTNLSFGDVAVNSTATQTFSFTNSNSSTAPIALSGVSFSSSMYSVTGSNCPGSLAIGASCSVTVQYAPTTVGAHNGTMTLNGDYDDGIVDVSGTGTPAPAGVLDLASTTGGFPNVQVGQTGTQTVTIGNTGNAPFSFTTAPAISGGDGKFTLASTCGASVAPGQTCTLTVTFAPTDTTPTTGYLNFDTNVSAPTSLSLNGTGVAAAVGAGAWSADYQQASAFTATTFPGTTVNATATAKTLYLRNSGAGVLSAAFALTGADAAHFKLTVAPVLSSDQAGEASCGASLTGAGAGSTECLATTAHPNIKVTLTYAPTAAGSHSAQLVATSANGSSVPGALTFNGTATDPLPSGYVQYGGKTYSVPRSGSWATASADCAATATLWGQNGWHLATITELETLRSAARRTSSPLVVLPTQWTVSKYWSGNAFPGDSSYKLVSDFTVSSTTVGSADGAGGVKKNQYANGLNSGNKYSCVKAI